MDMVLSPMRIQVACILSLCIGLYACGDSGDECSDYSDFSCKEIQNASYNVYFYFPSGSEEYLGRSQGLTRCGEMAHSFAYQKHLQGNRDWGYICCMRVKGSECYEKHR